MNFLWWKKQHEGNGKKFSHPQYHLRFLIIIIVMSSTSMTRLPYVVVVIAGFIIFLCFIFGRELEDFRASMSRFISVNGTSERWNKKEWSGDDTRILNFSYLFNRKYFSRNISCVCVFQGTRGGCA